MPVPQDNSSAQWLIEHWQQVIYHPVIASLTGAIGAYLHAFPGASPSLKAINGVSSFFVGIYLGPSIVEWREILSPRIGAAIIVGCALVGLVAMNAALEYLRSTPIAQWPGLRGFFGTPPP
jgi:hypothetical protein